MTVSPAQGNLPGDSSSGQPQLDLFARVPSELPDESALQAMFLRLKSDHFDPALPNATVRWSSRMRIAGSCDTRRHVITLSRAYHSHFPEDIEDTLKHEMIHLVNPNHDTAFRREAERIGTTIHCREYPGLHPRARFVYACPNCGTLFHRSRRERLYCGRCARYRLDPRFMLVLRSEADQKRVIQRLAAKAPSRHRPRRRKRFSSLLNALTGNLFGK